MIKTVLLQESRQIFRALSQLKKKANCITQWLRNHLDGRVADWLQNRLAGFPVPAMQCEIRTLVS